MSNSSCENFQSSAILVSLIFFIWLNKMKVTIGCKKSSLQLLWLKLSFVIHYYKLLYLRSIIKNCVILIEGLVIHFYKDTWQLIITIVL